MRNQKPPQPNLSFLFKEIPFEFCRKIYRAKHGRIQLLFTENRMIVASAGLSQYTPVTDRRRIYIMTISELSMSCNVRLKLRSVAVYSIGAALVEYCRICRLCCMAYKT